MSTPLTNSVQASPIALETFAEIMCKELPFPHFPPLFCSTVTGCIYCTVGAIAYYVYSVIGSLQRWMDYQTSSVYLMGYTCCVAWRLELHLGDGGMAYISGAGGGRTCWLTSLKSIKLITTFLLEAC